MRTTVTLDDDLLARAQELTGIRERSALIRDAVELLVRIESGCQLAALGGSDPGAEAAQRSRTRDTRWRHAASDMGVWAALDSGA